jgi:glycosyltransferase involved in cell wall biosynthesis
MSVRLMLLTADYVPEQWSGIGAAVERQAAALSKLGADVHVLYAPPRVGRVPKSAGCRDDGVTVHDLWQRHFPIDPRGFNWIHLHSLALSELAFELRRRTGTPLAYTAHSVMARELPGVLEAKFWSGVQRQVMRLSDAVIFLSESERRVALEIEPQLAAHSFVIGNGVDSQVCATPLGRRDSVMFAGRFTMSKGIAVLAELLPEINRRANVRFVLAGGHGEQQAERLILETSWKLGQRCDLLGWQSREKLDALFAQAAVVLVPSYYEPFGLVAVEAMRMGAPVVAANVGGLGEIIGPGSGGCLVSSYETADWLAQVLEILHSPALRDRLSRQGPAYVARRLNPLHFAARLMEQVYVH